MFIAEDTKVKHMNLTVKLNWKLFTKVIMSTKLIGLGSDRQRVSLKGKCEGLN
jgi:hypothetical protein